MEPQPRRARLSLLEWIAAVLCLIYGGLLVASILLGVKDDPFNVVMGALALVAFLSVFTLLRGARQLASACQYTIALCWLLISLLLLGILVGCGNRDAPGFLGVLLWGIGAACLAILHFVCARHIKSRRDE
ncbi:MAG: hypothetical protein NTX57_11425 [Armatimonadetes bacterium]|nr:hypothetical protein [Armatimonadota bacterium]